MTLSVHKMAMALDKMAFQVGKMALPVHKMDSPVDKMALSVDKMALALAGGAVLSAGKVLGAACSGGVRSDGGHGRAWLRIFLRRRPAIPGSRRFRWGTAGGQLKVQANSRLQSPKSTASGRVTNCARATVVFESGRRTSSGVPGGSAALPCAQCARNSLFVGM